MSLRVSRILHAGYLFECNGTQVAFDPIFENPFSRNCSAFPSVKFDVEQIRSLKLSAVFISHYHDDHCSLESLNLLDRQTPIYLYCIFEELFAMIRELGFLHVYPLQINSPVQIGFIQVIPRRALDEDVDSIFEIHAEGLKVLNVVDSWIGPETLDQLVQEAPWDLILWPFQTMREIEVLSPTRAFAEPPELPHEWLEQLKALRPKNLVPSSCQFRMEDWSWYNHAFFPITYRQFQEDVQAVLPEAQVIRMDPSCSIWLGKETLREAAPLNWIQPLGEQGKDYDFIQGLKAPPTSEIAKHFASLTFEQTKRVLRYCENEIIEKLNSIDPPEDPYFQKARLWRLSLYDCTGEVRHFQYLLKNGQLKTEPSDQMNLGWLTEVPISKLYAALEFGESLTSMYVRINDTVFDPQIEIEIESADIIEDPLIRALFTGVFGAYQKAQLKEIVQTQK